MNTRLTPCRIAARCLLLITAAGLCSCSGDESTAADEGDVAKTSPVSAVTVEPAAETGSPRRDEIAPPPVLPKSPPGVADLPSPGDEWLQRYANLDLDAAFNAIAKGVRYEPYRGVLRGAAGTALAQSGNSLDQSLLLATILQRSGFRVRFAQGRLGGDNLAKVLRGLYPPDVAETNFGPDFAPYDPKTDPGLDAAADHFWVEVYQPGDWLPLDPSFPRAVPGEAYASAIVRHDKIPKKYYQTLSISLKQELQNGEVSKLGSTEGRVADLGLTPISLIVHRVPKSSAESAKKPRGTSRTLGGMGGSLAGSKPDEPAVEEAPKPIAVEHQRRLFIGGEFVSWKNTLVAEQERAGFIKQEWLEFEVRLPEAAPVRTRRQLYLYQPDGPQEPQAVRHYSISVVPGPLSEDWLEEERARIGATLDLKKWQRETRNASKLEPGTKAADSLAPTLREYGDIAGIASGHLMGLTHAAASDALSRQVAWSSGVAIIWPIPRVLITSIETEVLEGNAAESHVTLDLRLDHVQSVPYPGFPARTAKLFQTARGLKNTALEGAVLSHATGLEVPVTTAVVMIKAADDGTPILTIDHAHAEQLANIKDLPSHSSELITAALRNGHDIIVPQRAARVAGRDRWGWWQVNRDTGEVIGVMEDGQHQATTNYTFSLSKVGLNDESGFAIGGIIGANTTLFAISGLMIKYGQTSPAMIAEVEAYVKSIMCRSCPSKAGVSAGASGGGSAGNDCFSIEKKVERTIGASVSIGFCESYQAGFSCASGLLLQGLTGGGGATAGVSAQAGVSVQVNCEHAFGGVKIGN
jgi:hypothetical protein